VGFEAAGEAALVGPADRAPDAGDRLVGMQQPDGGVLGAELGQVGHGRQPGGGVEQPDQVARRQVQLGGQDLQRPVPGQVAFEQAHRPFVGSFGLNVSSGSEQRVVIDGQWESATGAIRHADLLMGERHDLTREPRGWDAPGFDPAGWRPVRVRERDGTPLVADPGAPVRVTQELAPRSLATDDHGRHIVGFGQNLTGWLRVKVDGAPGTRIRIRHGEVLAADGTCCRCSARPATTRSPTGCSSRTPCRPGGT
jgi:hypothetical protein